MKLGNKIIVVVISIIGLYAGFLIVSDLATISDKISNFNTNFIPLIFLLVTSGWLVLFLRWHVLLRNAKIFIPVKDSFLIYTAGFSLTIIPGKVGELLKSQLLKSKLHRAKVTNVHLDYEGSCAIDEDLLEAASINEYEMIHIYNLNNGNRFVTYAIKAERGSGEITLNGAAAFQGNKNDLVIICTYCEINQKEVKSHKPKLIYFENNSNKIDQIKSEKALQSVSAIKNNQVYVLQNGSLSIASHNIVLAIEEISSIIYE